MAQISNPDSDDLEILPLSWGHEGPNWEINKKNQNIIKMTKTCLWE